MNTESTTRSRKCKVVIGGDGSSNSGDDAGHDNKHSLRGSQ